MATPLTASLRIHIPYQSQGRNHSIRMYVRLATAGLHPLIHVRSGDTGIDWRNASDQMCHRLVNILPVSKVFGTITLEQLTGILWNPIDSTGAPGIAGTGTPYPATQLTAVLRDSAFKKVRVVVLDINTPAPAHSPSEAGMPAAVTAFLDGYNASAGSFDPVNDPLNWQVSRGNNFLQDSPFTGVTIDLNDRVRRDAGLV